MLLWFALYWFGVWSRICFAFASVSNSYGEKCVLITDFFLLIIKLVFYSKIFVQRKNITKKKSDFYCLNENMCKLLNFYSEKKIGNDQCMIIYNFLCDYLIDWEWDKDYSYDKFPQYSGKCCLLISHEEVLVKNLSFWRKYLLLDQIFRKRCEDLRTYVLHDYCFIKEFMLLHFAHYIFRLL